MTQFIFKKQALKFLKRQSKIDRNRLTTAIYSLPAGDVKSLKGNAPLKRLRVGNFRVIFDDKSQIIQIIKIGNRGDIYK